MAPTGIDQIEIKLGTYRAHLAIRPDMDMKRAKHVVTAWKGGLFRGATLATRDASSKRYAPISLASVCAMFDVKLSKSMASAPAVTEAPAAAPVTEAPAPVAAAPAGIPADGIDVDAWIPDGSPVIVKGGRVYAAPKVTEAAAHAPVASAPEAPAAPAAPAPEAPAAAPKVASAPRAKRAAKPAAAPAPAPTEAPAAPEAHPLAPDFSVGLDANPIAIFTLGVEEIFPSRLTDIVSDRKIDLVVDIRSKVASAAFAIPALRASLGAKYATKSQLKGGLTAILPRLKAQGISRVLFIREEEAPGDHWGTLKMGQLATAAGYPIVHLYRNEEVTHVELWRAIEADLLSGGDHEYECEVDIDDATGTDAEQARAKARDRIAKLDRLARDKAATPAEAASARAEADRLMAKFGIKVAA